MEPPDQSSWIKEKILEHINRLENSGSDDEEFMEILENLNALLISANNRDVQQIAGELNLSRLFHLFNTFPEEKFCDELVRVFGMFMEALPMNEIFIKYHEKILEGLNSENITIVELWIKRVVKPLFTNEGLLKNISLSSVSIKPVLKVIIQLLVCESTSIASAAHDICVVISKTCRQEFFSPEILDELKKTKEYNFRTRKDHDQFLIRFYEVCIHIACVNQLLLDMMKAKGFLLDMIEDTKEKLDKDPLVAINFIKLITDLSSKSHGLEFLKNSTSILPFFAQKITDINSDDPFDALILPGYINFFIKIAQSDLTILNDYPIVINKLVEFCQKKQNGNREFQLLAIESIAFLCHQSENKLILADKMEIFLDIIIIMINGGNNELKSRAIRALNEIMEIQGADPGSKLTVITELWYNYLDSSNCGLDRFTKIVMEPFLDIRIPAMNFIRVLATTFWGQQLIANQSGFLDYLLDRSTESCNEGREAKFEIIRELAMSPFIRQSFPLESQLRIRGYFKDGPINKEVHVAFENL